jgi:signal transduction histidine kinase
MAGRSDRSRRLAQNVHARANNLIGELRSLLRDLEASYEHQAFTQQVDDAILRSDSNPASVLDFIIRRALVQTSSLCGRIIEYCDGQLTIVASTDSELVGQVLPLEGSLCGLAVTTNRDQRIADVGLLPPSQYKRTHDETKGELALLISPGVGRRVFGVLDLQRADGGYNDVETAFASALAGQLAIVIQHSRERQAYESIFATLAAPLPGGMAGTDAVYGGFVRAVLRALNANHGQLMRWTGSDFMIVASSQPADVGIRLKGSAIGRYAFDQGGAELLVIEDIAESEYAADYVPMLMSPHGKMITEAILPLRVGGELVGALNVESRHKRAFSEHETHLLRELQDPLARALYATSEQFRRLSRERIEAAQLALGSVRTATGGLLHRTGGSVSDARFRMLRIRELQEQGDLRASCELLSELAPSILHSLDAASRDLKKLTNSLQPDQEGYEPLVVDLLDLCRAALERARGRHHTVAMVFEDRLPSPPDGSDLKHVVTGAPCELDAQAEELFVNLLDNAARAIIQRWGLAQTGQVTLTLDLADSGNARVTVTDNGIGMTREVSNAVFKYGFSGRADGDESHGVGLWWCHLYVQQYGGSIRVESEAGVGTTFEVLLPLSQQPVLPMDLHKDAGTY